MTVQRTATVIGIRPEAIEAYKKLHAAVWPEILATISDCNIRNYSIFLKEPENLLFGYFEYVGSDWQLDARKMASDPKTREWWALTDPCQVPLPNRKPGEWWASLEEVFHND